MHIALPSLSRGIAVIALLLGASAVQASLLGHQVTGSIKINGGATNFFDPANTFVSSDTLNFTQGTTVTISDSASEFGVEIGGIRDIANFTATQLIISAFANPQSNGALPWLMTFTSLEAGLFTGVSLVSDTFDPDINFALFGDTIIVSWAGTNNGDHMFSAVFDIQTTGDIPEPASFALVGAALLAAGIARRRHAG